jgi:prepilin-type N-terminal cleavage/methylation domain-containing protein
VLSLPGRRGFTLLELVVSTCVMLIVSGAVYRVLLTTQRLSRAQARQIAAQSAVRAGTLLVANELRKLSPADLVLLGSSSLTFRMPRGIGFLCQAPSATQIRIGRAGFFAQRDPQAVRDSLFLFLEGAAETEMDDIWLELPITQVSNTAACAGTLEPGITLTVPSTAALAGVPAGTPARIYELMELKLYRSEGRAWLGARSVSSGETIQPVIGPLSDDDGFRLEYLDGAGFSTTDPNAVNRIRITLRSFSDRSLPLFGEQSMIIEDELSTQVALRNLRP